MSITYCFFDFKYNYNLRFYFENLGCDLTAFTNLDEEYRPLSERCNHFANFMGRLPVLGRVAGPLRVSYGIVKTPLCAIGALSAAIAAGASRPFSKRICYKCLYGATLCGLESLDGIKHIGRGTVETIPIAGCYQFVQYDNQNIMKI